MKNLFLSFFLFLVSLPVLAIDGGQVVSGDDAKSTVFLRHGDGQDLLPCTGFVVINPSLIMTAAHCVTKKQAPGYKGPVQIEKVIEIYQTTNFMSAYRKYRGDTSQMKKIEINADQVTVNESYGKIDADHTDAQDSDVALIKLTTPLRNVTPLQIGGNQSSKEFKVLGYGSDGSNIEAGTLRQTQLSRGDDVSRFIFSIDANSKTGICPGDSGSPAFTTDDKGQKFLVGIAVAANLKNGECVPSGYFLSMDKFHEWIQKASGVQLADMVSSSDKTLATPANCNQRRSDVTSPHTTKSFNASVRINYLDASGNEKVDFVLLKLNDQNETDQGLYNLAAAEKLPDVKILGYNILHGPTTEDLSDIMKPETCDNWRRQTQLTNHQGNIVATTK